MSTEDEDGAPGRKVVAFDTSPPQDQEALDVTFGPDAGTYGVGQPVTAALSAPVKDKAARAVVERALQVDSTPRGARAPGTGWTTRPCTTGPRSTGPPTRPSTSHSNLAGVKIGDRLYGGAPSR